MGLINEKNRGKKSRDTARLKDHYISWGSNSLADSTPRQSPEFDDDLQSARLSIPDKFTSPQDYTRQVFKSARRSVPDYLKPARRAVPDYLKFARLTIPGITGPHDCHGSMIIP